MSGLPLKFESEVKMSSYAASRRPWLSRRVATILIAFLFSLACLVFFSQQEQFQFDLTAPRSFSQIQPVSDSGLDCTGRDTVGSIEHWNAAEAKYRHLSDDKFTYVLPWAFDESILTSSLVLLSKPTSDRTNSTLP